MSQNITLINELPSLQAWIAPLIDCAKAALSEWKKVFIVTIARKMARLFEYYQIHNAKLCEFMDTFRKDVTVITEHAIPCELNECSIDDTEIIVVDDLIVYGTTVKNVTENIYYLTGIRPKVIAMAAAKRQNDNIQDNSKCFRCADLVFPDAHTDNHYFLSQNQVAAFTAKNGWDIVSLGKSIDLEFPILKLKADNINWNIFERKGNRYAHDFFKSQSYYLIRHHIPYTEKSIANYTISLDHYFDIPPNNDFNKLRFFASETELSVVSYAPVIWYEKPFASMPPQLPIDEMQTCVWIMRGLFYKDEPKAVIDDRVMASIYADRYIISMERTLILWLNYLVSLYSIGMVKGEVEAMLSDITSLPSQLTLDIKDVALLVGPKVAYKVFPLLKDILESAKGRRNTFVIGGNRQPGVEQPLIPAQKIEEYRRSTREDVLMSGTSYIALSLIFNRLWNQFGRLNNFTREDKIHIGETVDSLFVTLRNVFIAPDLKMQINRWLDTNIDLGAVVPKYDYSETEVSRRTWRRYFRACERENLMIDVARSAYCVWLYLGSKDELHFEDFKDIICSEVENLNKKSDGQVPLEMFQQGIRRKCEYSDDYAFAVYALWIYMFRLGLITILPGTGFKIALLSTPGGECRYASTAVF